MNKAINISLIDASNKTWKFTGLRELTDFVRTENIYWREAKSNLPSDMRHHHPYIDAHNSLQNILNTIESWNSQLESWDNERFNQELQGLQRNYLNSLRNQWIWSGHPYSNFYAKIHQDHGRESAAAFIDFIIRGQITNISDKSSFIGILLAYEFTYQDSDLVKRRRSERASLDQIRNRLSDTTGTLIGETEELKGKFNEWSQSTKTIWESFIQEATTNQENNASQAASDHQNQLTAQKMNLLPTWMAAKQELTI